MDRLPSVLYHATPPGNVEAILRLGIVPQDASASAGPDGIHANRVFLSRFDDPSYMNLPADKIAGAVVLAVDTSRLDPSRLYPDDSIYAAYVNDWLSDDDVGTLFPEHRRMWEESGAGDGFGEWMDDNGPSDDEIERLLAGRFGLTLWNSAGISAPFELGEVGYEGSVPPEAVSVHDKQADVRRSCHCARALACGRRMVSIAAAVSARKSKMQEMRERLEAAVEAAGMSEELAVSSDGRWIYLDRKPEGTMSKLFTSRIRPSDGMLWLTMFEVPEKKKGAGRRFMEKVEEIARAAGVTRIDGEALHESAGFWKTIGYEETGIRKTNPADEHPYHMVRKVLASRHGGEPAFLARLRDAGATPPPEIASAAVLAVVSGTLVHNAAGSAGGDAAAKVRLILDSGIDPEHWVRPAMSSPGAGHPKAAYLSLAWEGAEDSPPPNYVFAKPALSAPLVLWGFNADGDYIWGKALAKATGKSGAALTSFLRRHGYDSIITVREGGGDIGEIAYFGLRPLPAYLPSADRTAGLLAAAAETVRRAAVEDIYRGVREVVTKYKGSGLFARFSDVPKVGIRPSTEHHDPYGVYFYPVDWLAEEGGWGTTYINLPYITVARIRRSGWLNLGTVRPDKARQLAEKGGVLDEYTALRGGRAGKRLWDAVEAKVKPFESEANKMDWNRIFGRMGVKAIYDPGTGSVNMKEPAQIVVLDLSLIDVVAVVENREDRKSVFYAVLKVVADGLLDEGWRVAGSHAEGGIWASGAVGGAPVELSAMPAKSGFEMEVTLSYHDASGKKRRVVSRGRMPNEWEDASADYLAEGHVKSLKGKLEGADMGPAGAEDIEDALDDILRSFTNLRLPDITVKAEEGTVTFWKNSGDGKIEGSLRLLPSGRKEMELYIEDWFFLGGRSEEGSDWVVEIGPMRVSWDGDLSSAKADMTAELARAVRELRVTDLQHEPKEIADREALVEFLRMRQLGWVFPQEMLDAAGIRNPKAAALRRARLRLARARRGASTPAKEFWQMTRREFMHPKFDVRALDRIANGREGEAVGTLGDYFRGENLRALYAPVLDTPIMVISGPVEGGKRVRVPEGYEFKGALGTFRGKTTIFLPSGTINGLVRALLEEGAHAMRESKGRESPKTSMMDFDWDAYEALPHERSAAAMSEYALSLTEKDHREFVEEALAAGKPVPPEVLADYPEMALDAAARSAAALARAAAAAETWRCHVTKDLGGMARVLRRAAEAVGEAGWSEESDVDSTNFRDEGFVPDESGHTFWGSRGSGLLFVRDHPEEGRQLLAVHRSSSVEEPDTWGTTGGAVPKGETNDFASAVRETREEIGSIPKYRPVRQYVWKAPAPGTFQYTTFIVECLDPDWLPDAFNWEAQDARWVSLDEAGSLDLHFGLADLLNKLGESIFPPRSAT